MKFKLPEDISKLSIEELAELRVAAVAESVELTGISDDDITDAQLDDLEALGQAVDQIDAQTVAVTDAAAERTERLAAARTKAAAAAEPADEVEVEPADEVDAEVVEDVEVEAEERQPVLASARGGVARAAKKAPAVIIHDAPVETPKTGLIAAASVPGYESGATLADFTEVAKAFEARSRGYKNKRVAPGSKGLTDQMGVARIVKAPNEFTIDNQSASEQMAIVLAAAEESRLPKGGLIAAGGWCAPSETVYDFCSFETVSGILSIPEITIRRGGINFTQGPDYSALAATWGFLQTEAQAEAGTVKVCYEIDCPPFAEVRLDAIGFCVKNGILTNVGYPELTRRVLEIGAVAHAHKVNASVISRISTYIGAATDYVEIGSATADLLDALTIQAVVLRYQFAMDPDATIEAVLPIWAREIVRSDLSRRQGVDLLAVTNQQIQGYFGVRNVAPQWVYDYQPIATGAGAGTAWPTTLEAMLYPAGAFVKGTTDVIDLDTIYDSEGLSTNTYTAAFFEEGLLVANTCGKGRKVSISLTGLSDTTGIVGNDAIGAPVAP